MSSEGHLGGDWHPRGTEIGENKCGQNSHQSEYEMVIAIKYKYNTNTVDFIVISWQFKLPIKHCESTVKAFLVNKILNNINNT